MCFHLSFLCTIDAGCSVQLAVNSMVLCGLYLSPLSAYGLVSHLKDLVLQRLEASRVEPRLLDTPEMQPSTIMRTLCSVWNAISIESEPLKCGHLAIP